MTLPPATWVVATIALLAAVSIAACSDANRTADTPGARFDAAAPPHDVISDAAITTRVNTELAKDKRLPVP